MSAATDRAIEALRMAVRQNEHDMMMTGEELREASAALAAVDAEPVQDPVAALVRVRHPMTPARIAFDGKDHFSDWSEWKPESLEFARAVTDPARNTPPIYEMVPLYTAPPTPQPVQEPVAGWKLVPVGPTKEMIQAACDKHGYPGGSRWVYWDGYNAMLAVAPTPPTPQRQPLTDEQINDILQRNHIPALPPEWEDCDFQIARAIERECAKRWGVTL